MSFFPICMWGAIENVKLGIGGFVFGGGGKRYMRMFTVNDIVITAGSEIDGPEEDPSHYVRSASKPLDLPHRQSLL